MGPCLSEDVVLALVGGGLSDRALEEAELHLDGCRACRAVVVCAAQCRDDVARPLATSPLPQVGHSAGSYRLVRCLGSGGMGAVFEGVHGATGQRVAIKILHPHISPTADLATRIVNEARAANLIQHPGIVSVFETGRLGDGRLFLVMDLLDGLSLAAFLEEVEQVPVADALRLARQIAAALAAAHERGIFHRDLKPDNIFLVDDARAPGGRRVKILDFGIAKLPRQLQRPGAHVETAEGMLLGTPLYMAPEQCRGAERVTDRADVYAFGVILYEMLAGRPPFEAQGLGPLLELHMRAEPPPLDELRRELAPELVALVRTLLAKEPGERPSMAQLVERLASEAIGAGAEAVSSNPSLTATERRLVALVLARRGAGDDLEELGEQADALGAHLERTADGSAIFTLTSAGTATDLAARAARLALAVHGVRAGVRLAVVTGRSTPVRAASPSADLVGRAATLLAAAAAEAPVPIRIDDVTAGLLDVRFDVTGDAEGLILRRERDEVDAARTLLGQRTPFVARDAELVAIEAAFSACVGEDGGRAVLVTGPPGVGKSRLRWEALQRLARHAAAPEVIFGRGDPMSAGGPFVLLADAIRRAAGVQAGEALELRRRKLRARVARHLAEPDVQRVAEFLGEMVGTHFPVEDSAQLRAARADPMLLRDQLQRAFEDWLAAECAATPVILVLEDLHWGDQPTVTFIDQALHDLADRPLLVIAVGRPEVHLAFPRLWSGRRVSEIRLGEVGRKAAERLVRAVLGPATADAVVGRVVDRAGGNALFLEELIRAVVERGGDSLPATVLAMVQARLEAMEPPARQVLRAASVFGDELWRGGVAALLGGQERAGLADEWLDELVRREVMTARPLSRVSGEREYRFRHALVRDAAYAMLTDDDRRLGHRLAAGWLIAAGESDAVMVAEHLERGGEPGRAAEWWQRAAAQALAGNDLADTIGRAQRGMALGAGGEIRGRLLLLSAVAHAWRGEIPQAEADALAAMGELAPHGDAWFAALGEAAAAAGVRGAVDRLDALLAQLGEASAVPPGPQQVVAATRLWEQLLFTGGADQAAHRLLASLEPLASLWSDSHPEVAARVTAALALRASYAGDPGTSLELADAAAALFERAGDQRNACIQRGRSGYARLEIGAYEEAEAILGGVVAVADKMGLATGAAVARHNLGLVLARLGKHELARATEVMAAQSFGASGNRRMEGASYEYLALIELEAGEPAAAEAAARRALAIATDEPRLATNEAESLTILARALAATGRLAEARLAAGDGLRLLEELGGIDDGEALIRLTWVEILQAMGDSAAVAAASAARQRLLVRAERIRDARVRASFLERVPENARTLTLASGAG